MELNQESQVIVLNNNIENNTNNNNSARNNNNNNNYNNNNNNNRGSEADLDKQSKRKGSILTSFTRCWKSPERQAKEKGSGSKRDTLLVFKKDETKMRAKSGEHEDDKKKEKKEKNSSGNRNRALRSKSCLPEGLSGTATKVAAVDSMCTNNNIDENSKELLRAVPDAPQVWSEDDAASLIKAVWRARETRRSMPHILPLIATQSLPPAYTAGEGEEGCVTPTTQNSTADEENTPVKNN
ncbi:uncharacterized protein LOC142355373 isoform X2 [Convolutriloba macropyga]|uniref:uncharacterized protein LOC142355373 isoform X2 n=1 Tax=Convolutriloba macropyga TaxID=536237 RepID=UPI003F524B61